MSRRAIFSAAPRAGILAGVLAFTLAGASLYTHNVRAPEARGAGASSANITLATGTVAAPRAMRELARARAQAQAATRVVIVWPTRRGARL